MAIRGIIFDYGGVIWDMRWDIARELSLQHGLEERAVVEAMYRNELWQPLEVGVGERDVWLTAVQAELDRQGGKPMPPLHHTGRNNSTSSSRTSTSFAACALPTRPRC